MRQMECRAISELGDDEHQSQTTTRKKKKKKKKKKKIKGIQTKNVTKSIR
jgi:hypothetical protein